MKSFWFAVITAVIWGIVPLMEKIGLSKGMNPMLAVFWRTAGCMLAAFILLLFIARDNAAMKSAQPFSIFMLAAGGALAAVVGQVFFYKALQGGSISTVVPIAGSFPLIAFVTGVLFLGEAVTPAKIAGMVCVLAGVYLLK